MSRLEWRISRVWRPVPAKVGAVLEPQRPLGGPDSLFVSAVKNGAKFNRKMSQTQATAPQFQKAHIFSVIFASESQSRRGGAICAPSRVFEQKSKSTHIHDVFRILFGGWEIPSEQ